MTEEYREYIFLPTRKINVAFCNRFRGKHIGSVFKRDNESVSKRLETVSLVANEMLSSNKGKEKQSMLSEEIRAIKI